MPMKSPRRPAGFTLKSQRFAAGRGFAETVENNGIEGTEFQRLTAASLTRDEINSSGYVVDTLEAALWSILHTRNYRNCILCAANLGGDTDTTCAVVGGLAGIIYGTGGTKGIPEKWIAKLARIEWITVLFNYFDKRIHDSGK